MLMLMQLLMLMLVLLPLTCEDDSARLLLLQLPAARWIMFLRLWMKPSCSDGSRKSLCT